MRLPQFTAECSVYITRGCYTSVVRRQVTARHEVVAQLMGSRFPRWRGGGFGTLGDYWACRDECGRKHSACLDTCEGTWGSPKGSSNCIICDDNYRACVTQCAGDIA